MTMLELSNISKSYAAGERSIQVLDNINLSVTEGEFVAIVGFSGSGKTTLISIIAGLLMPDQGKVLVKGEAIRGAGPDRGIVFQNYSLMPWLTVYGNIALAVNQVFSNWPAQQRRQHIEKYIEMVGLTHAIDRRPAELSGGMRQRVAVARALAMQPNILLLDEPLSALDALTRAKLQDEVEQIWRKERKTVILITNDVDEALLLADRIIPLNPGPKATLGPEFKVNIPRPRERTELNHNASYKKLRGEITQYLLNISAVHNQADQFKLKDIAISNDSAEVSAFSQDKYVEFSQVVKIYPTPKGPLTIVDEFHLKIKKGEFISLIGHSGCGKSTVLSMAAGLTDISKGAIILDGREIDGAGPERAMVFQSPSLFPWLTAVENVLLGVQQVFAHLPKSEQVDMVEYYLSRVGLADAMHKYAADLSNGMKQRVGIARAFALKPKLLLLDEPFGMLDSLTRWELQELLMEVWTKSQVTAICVTHDVDEAILLADRVVMMTNGPYAKIGHIMEVNLPRPRTRQALLEHPQYYFLRQQLLSFLENCDHQHKKPTAEIRAIKPSVPFAIKQWLKKSA